MKSANIKLIISMIIFGTIGVFVQNINIGSAYIAAFRGLGGGLFLLIFMCLKKQKIAFPDIRKNIVPLLLSGLFIGFNWIFLFESYKYTSVAISTICYYTAPAIVILLSFPILREKPTIKKFIGIAIALIGMLFVSGVFTEQASETKISGIIFGLLAAFLYALVIICNKKIKDINAFDKTVVQLFTAAITVLPYAFFMEEKPSFSENGLLGNICLVLVAIIHTGVSYTLYFGSMDKLPASKIAITSYIDPVVAIVCSATLLNEKLTVYTCLGAILIIFAAVLTEDSLKIRKSTTN